MEPLNLSRTCYRHPSTSFTGFCPSCLHDRLSSLHIYNDTISTTHRNSTSIVSSSTKNPSTKNPSQLRRCKSTSFTANKIDNGGAENLKSIKELIDLEPSSRPNKNSLKVKIHKWIRKWRGKENKPVEKETTAKTEEKKDKEKDEALKVSRKSCCDLEPGRISVEYPRYSLDESLLIGSRPVMSGRQSTSKLSSVFEEVRRSDGDLIAMPGGSEQTKDYYFDTSSRSRRRSLDRLSSVRKSDFEGKCLDNAKVSPELFRGWSSSSFKNDDFDPGFSLEKILTRKKSKKWGILGFMQRNNSSTESRGGDTINIDNVVERSFSNAKSNSSVSSRSSTYGNSSRADNDMTGKKRGVGFVLGSNRSARYESPRHIDNGMLRFYLTPMRSSSSSGSSRRTLEKGRHSNVYPSYSKSVLQLY